MQRPVLEIRLHGRGGQGGVTCAKIIAAVYADLGKSVQTFGDYAGERSGAPVRAYTRVSDEEVQNRNKVYEPDHLVVLDPTLLGDDVVAGLAPGGTLLVNTPEPLASFKGRFAQFRLAVVDATAIARKHRIGTRSVVIVNTTIAGAFARALDLPMEALKDAYLHLGLASNMDAAREAFEAVQVREPESVVARAAKSAQPATTLAPVLALTDQVESAPTGLRTGSWRTQRPVYAEHVAPCNAFCPAGNDVVGFVQALLHGDEAAAAVLMRTTPLPGTCGRVCPAPCMDGCNRREYDGAVNIRGLERWIADHAPAPQPIAKRTDAKRFAVIGGGPAGLAAAWTLAREGQHVTIFDGEPALGGVLRTGIPEYRLPRAVVDREVDAILALGVETSLGDFLDARSLEDIAGSFDATILATGLQSLRSVDGGADAPAGVEQGIAFLHRLNAGEPIESADEVVVLGGGNTAMDCARSALRAGAAKVTVVYRRGRAEMPAIAEEVEQAEHEGIEFAFLLQPVGYTSLAGRVRGVVVAEVELGPPDDTGRRRPVITDRRRTIPCDHALLALGSSADLSLLPRGWTLEAGRILRDGTPSPIFAAGDVATGDGTVTHAIGSGRRAAGRAMQHLGFDVVPFERPDRALAVPVTDIRLDHFATAPSAQERLLPAEQRARSLRAEVSAGLPDALEAHRCFSCGHCTQCDTCLVYCPEGIIRRRDPSGTERYEVDYSFCKGCGICVTECPRKAMEMSQ